MRAETGRLDALRGMAGAPRDRSASPAALRLRESALALAAAEGLGECRYTLRIVPLQRRSGGELWLEGRVLFAPRLVPASGELTALAFAACTVGEALEARVRSLFQARRPSLAMSLDALGNEMLGAVSRRAQDRLQGQVSRLGLTMAGELRPGDPGLGLEAHEAVLALSGGAQIGIRVYGQGLLAPLKSATMVLGVGRDLPEANWSRCDGCRSRDRCRWRRAAAGSAMQRLPA